MPVPCANSVSPFETRSSTGVTNQSVVLRDSPFRGVFVIEFVVGLLLSVCSVFFLLLVCTALECAAPRERVPLRNRAPGALMVFVGYSLSIFVAWPLRKLWDTIGLEGIELSIAPLGFVGGVVTVLLLNDFLTYWRHRAEHRWFWPIHAVHHSP